MCYCVLFINYVLFIYMYTKTSYGVRYHPRFRLSTIGLEMYPLFKCNRQQEWLIISTKTLGSRRISLQQSSRDPLHNWSMPWRISGIRCTAVNRQLGSVGFVWRRMSTPQDFGGQCWESNRWSDTGRPPDPRCHLATEQSSKKMQSTIQLNKSGLMDKEPRLSWPAQPPDLNPIIIVKVHWETC